VDTGMQPADRPECTIHLDDGQTLIVPANWLQEQHDGTYFIPMNRSQLDAAAWTQVVSTHAERSGEPREPFADGSVTKETADAHDRVEEVIPVVREEAVITKREVVKGSVRINKHVHEREETVDAQGMIEEVVVERVPVGRMIDKSPGIRYEGETMIIPVLEEVLVVEKRLRLKEEVRVTKHTRQIDQPHTVHLRAEEIDVERLDS
jgi:uncharacterized protein (TIGR02271 family)